MWDEWDQFYTDLNEFFQAIEKQAYRNAIKQF